MELTALRKHGEAAVQIGESPEDVAWIPGISRGTIYKSTTGRRRTGQAAGMRWMPGSVAVARNLGPDGEAMAWSYKAIADKMPGQYEFPFARWTSKLVAKLIRERLGIRLSKAPVCRLMNQTRPVNNIP